MIHNKHTHDDTRPKRRDLRLAMVVASAMVAGGIIVPASAAVAAPMPRSSAVSPACLRTMILVTNRTPAWSITSSTPTGRA
jgi:hypothetical protein